MHRCQLTRIALSVLLLAVQFVAAPNPAFSSEWHNTSKPATKLATSSQWKPRLVSEVRPESSSKPTASEPLEPLFLMPVSLETGDVTVPPAPGVAESGSESGADVAPPDPDSVEVPAPASAPSHPAESTPDATSDPVAPVPAADQPAPTDPAHQFKDTDSAIVLEGPEQWRPRLPFEQSSMSWTLRGDDNEGIGFFSLEGGPAMAAQFDIPQETRFKAEFQTAIHWVNGPGRTDLPPRMFDLFYNVHLTHPINQVAGVDANFNLGLFTDFEDSVRKGWRFPGRTVVYANLDTQTQIVGGFEYLDTDILKMLPAGGVIYTPNDDVRLELYFPRPAVRFRTKADEESQSWMYLSGEYQARAWAIERSTTGKADVANLNDYRASLGFEHIPKKEGDRTSFFEVSWLFNRQLEYRSGAGNYNPDDTVMFRWGTRF